MRRLFNWLRPPAAAVQLSSVPYKPPDYTPEQITDLLAALASHPGFEYLIGCLHNRRLSAEQPLRLADPLTFDTMIENTIRHVRHDTERIERTWLETQVLAAVRTQTRRPSAEPVPAATAQW